MADLDTEDPDPAVFAKARAIVANGSDQQYAALVLAARQQGFAREIIALADRPLHRKPMMLAGANAVYTPLHILAAARGIAGQRAHQRAASGATRPRVGGEVEKGKGARR